MATKIEVDFITIKVPVYQPELKKYGKNGLKQIFEDLVERYFCESYYNSDLVQEILEERNEKK